VVVATPPSSLTPLQRVLDALHQHGCSPRRVGSNFSAKCPAHDDRNPSLSVTEGKEGRVLIHCHTGCVLPDILFALGLEISDIFALPLANVQDDDWTPCGCGVAREYPYVDPNGELLFMVVRCPQKHFAQWRPDNTARTGRRWSLGNTTRVPYRLPMLLEAIREKIPVFVVEGEKDADRLVAEGYVATCNPHGAGRWNDYYSTLMAGATVTIIADKDEPGRLHAEQVATSLKAHGCTVAVKIAAVGKDVTDHLNAGKKLDELIPVDVSRPYTIATDAPEPPKTNGHKPHSDLDKFWDERPGLQHIRDFARASMVSPWSMLGAVLARIVAATPPFVVLPRTIGGEMSLNLFVGFVGPSGGGKGASERAAESAVRLPEPITKTGPGSGEGIAHLFQKYDKKQDALIPVATAVLMSAAEVDTLSALTGRQASTLMPELRKTWSGEELGFAYVDPEKKLKLQGHTYRLCLTVGIQPGRAGQLLNDSDGGTPQRFVWLPVADPGAPDETPEHPPPRIWHRPALPKADFTTRLVILPICSDALAAVRANRLAQLREEGELGIEAHGLLSRLKVAAALGLYDERAEISSEDWRLAGIVMAVSDSTREKVAKELAKAVQKQNRARAELEAERALLIEGRKEIDTLHRVGRTMVRKLDAGRWVSKSDLRKAVSSRDRGYFEAALDKLRETALVEERDTGHGIQFRLHPRKS
jgi:5S rRNA maturation endonuclease (ribonuclease M5)